MGNLPDREAMMNRPCIWAALWTLSLFITPMAAAATAEIGDVSDYAVIDVEQILSTATATQTTTFKREFTTYTLFLFPSARWLASADSKRTVEELRRAYHRFGRAAGDNNLAIWFRRENDPDQPDTDRAALLARAFKLDANDGPYVIYIRPNAAKTLNLLIQQTGHSKFYKVPFRSLQNALFPDGHRNFVALNVSSISPKCTVDVLNQLGADLKLEQGNPSAELRRQASGCTLVEGMDRMRGFVKEVAVCLIGVVKEVEVGATAGVGRSAVSGNVRIAFNAPQSPCN